MKKLLVGLMIFPCYVLAHQTTLTEKDFSEAENTSSEFYTEIKNAGLDDFLKKERMKCEKTQDKYLYCAASDDMFLQELAYKEGFLKGLNSPYEHIQSHALSLFSPSNRIYHDMKYNDFEKNYIKKFGKIPAEKIQTNNIEQKENELKESFKFAYLAGRYAQENHFYDYRLR